MRVFSTFASLAAVTLISALSALAPSSYAQSDAPALSARDSGNIDLFVQADLDVYIKSKDQTPLPPQVIVTVTTLAGKFYNQSPAKNGYVRFNGVPPTEYVVVVSAPGFARASKNVDMHGSELFKVNIELQPLSDSEDASSSAGLYALPPKVQRDVGKALEALRANRPNDALHPLQAAQKSAPNSAEIEYLFGLYASQNKDEAQAKAHWLKAIELNPKHLSALLGVSFDLLHENKAAEAVPYLSRAVEAEPSSWRAHALLAEAMMLQGDTDQAIKHAQRAIELGHDRASSSQAVLARAYAVRGDRGLATQAMEAYVKAHPTDATAAKDLENLKNPAVNITASGVNTNSEMNAAAADAAAVPVASNWRPADIDESMPSVEPGTACAVDDVVKKAGLRIAELVTDVDRFAATENLVHESINKYGLPSSPEKRKFDYVVAIQTIQQKYFDVEEYRNGAGGVPADFPEGVATNGLPALVLIFHPFNIINFDVSCEGLSRTSTGLAWQVHFKQRADKPNYIKRYRIGADGPSYPVALKGRAWFSADTYQIVRLETDLVAPVPEIKLVADHTNIEYGPVKFQDGKINMWLPQSAEIFYDWKGRRIHRRHSFTHYMLFGVDEKQKISVPKADDTATDSGPSSPNEKP